jgi:alpha-glucosidase (family GH31 glycosyl hydrolase)
MDYMVCGDKYRISVLTDRLIRLEYSENGQFEDRLTMMVAGRDLKCEAQSVRREDGLLFVETKELLLTYNEKEFASNGLSIELKNFGTCWHYSHEYTGSGRNMRGTARTLDNKDGGCELEAGIFGRDGYAIINDSASPVIVYDEDNKDGKFVQRETGALDLYFFGYGKDFYGALKDFYALCGKTPMIPRYALGNWWSRYFKYTEESYNEVLENFEKEQIPLSVAVIDMDWHVTEVDPKYGTGWTGYTWNKEMFPDYKRFLRHLHDCGLSVTLNLHPADGVRAFEDMYKEVAASMGIDPETEEAVEFDFEDPAFRAAYFDKIMHPYEKDGVDFWWIDWQQGTGRKAGDVDPLILLNHYHYKDQEGRNIRPMIFSRYAGPGSHRYPIGFSGDTVCTWKSLQFQPFFTSTASNIGYGWWSHDIGGHMMGDKSNERLIRWIQYGVFSPIMRLHSTSSAFFNKEPWTIEEPYHTVMQEFLRLRHRLVPYLYTENYRAYKEDKPLVRPMYYDNPDNADAYSVGSEYGYGEELLVGAITEPVDEGLKLGSVNMLIPEGRYADILTGRVYRGGKRRKLYRDINTIPVLMKEGGILPLAKDDRSNTTANPSEMEIVVVAGADGKYELYEDDGVSMDFLGGKYATTLFEVSFGGDSLKFTVNPVAGDLSLIPEKRDYTVKVLGAVSSEGEEIVIELKDVDASKGSFAEVTGIKLVGNDHKAEVFKLLDRAWISNMVKDMIFDALGRMNDADFLTWLSGADVSEVLKDAIEEIFED